MGNASGTCNAKSTAKEVIEAYGEGSYLAGKTAVVTGTFIGIYYESLV